MKLLLWKKYTINVKVRQSTGSCYGGILYRNIPIFEYAPKKIKMAITGNGNASKEQVSGMLKSILNIKDMPKNLDASDGLAAAYVIFTKQNSK